MSEMAPEQQDVAQRARLAMIAARSPLVTLGRGRGRPPGRSKCKRCGELGHYAKTCGRQAPPAPPVAVKPPSRIRRHRVDGHNHCAVCGELGHTRKRHESSAPSVLAARAVADDGLTLAVAAARFSVSRQAVDQALRRHIGDQPTPAQQRWRLNKLRAATLALIGRSVSEICAETGAHDHTVRRYLDSMGVEARHALKIPDDDVAAAASAVTAGSSYADVAADLGYSPARLADRLRGIGVHSSASARGRTDGRTKRAIDRVIAGESVQDACKAERCATPMVYRTTIEIRKARSA